MSLAGYWNDLISLQAPGSTDAAQNLSNETDAKLLAADQAYAQRQVAAGNFTQDQANAYDNTSASAIGYANTTPDASVATLQAQYAAEANGTGGGYQPISVSGQEQAALAQGVLEGATNIRKTVNGAVGFSLKTIWTLVPWYVWLGGAVALFFYFGGSRLITAEAGKHWKKRYG